MGEKEKGGEVEVEVERGVGRSEGGEGEREREAGRVVRGLARGREKWGEGRVGRETGRERGCGRVWEGGRREGRVGACSVLGKGESVRSVSVRSVSGKGSVRRESRRVGR
jgi:hypothetical protein